MTDAEISPRRKLAFLAFCTFMAWMAGIGLYYTIIFVVTRVGLTEERT